LVANEAGQLISERTKKVGEINATNLGNILKYSIYVEDAGKEVDV
jgi:hypothetical protein